MSYGVVPPTIENPKNVIGVGNRELIILGTAVLILFGVIALPIDVTFKVGAGVLLGGVGLVLAFGREPRTGKTIEAYLLQIFRFRSRTRFHQRGADNNVAQATPVMPAAAAASPSSAASASDGDDFEEYRPDSGGYFVMRPVPLTGSTFLTVVSLAFLAFVLAWTWAGGLEEVFYYYR